MRYRMRAAAAVLFSPRADLTHGGRSVHEKAQTDVLLDAAKLAGAAGAYVGALPLDDPPVFRS